jgi:hypothetical protein
MKKLLRLENISLKNVNFSLTKNLSLTQKGGKERSSTSKVSKNESALKNHVGGDFVSTHSQGKYEI